jgi:NADH:ubiquinone oxidoreductase subunit K
MIASSAFWSNWAWAAATAVVGFIFFALVLRQYLARRKPHQLAWSVGLCFYAVAAAMEAWSEYSGHWDPTVYRFYIVLAASLVGFLGLGTLYLMVRDRRWGDAYLAFLLVCLVVFFVGTFTAQLDTAKLVPGITVGGQALGPSLSFPRVMSLPFNITGTILLFGGAAWSIGRFARRREYGYRVWANVFIAAGAALLAFLGSRARLGNTTGLYPAEMVAVTLMFAGFLLAGTLDKGARKVQARRKAAAGGTGS